MNFNSLSKIAFFILGIVLIYSIQNILLLLFLTFVIASGLNPLINFIQKKIKISRGLTTFYIVVLFFGLVGTAIYFSIQSLLSQSTELIDEIPIFASDLVNRLGLSSFVTIDTNQSIYQTINSFLNNSGGNFSLTILSYSSSVLSGLITLITMGTITFYQLIEPTKINNFIVSLVNKKNRKRTESIVKKIEFKLGKWFIGQFSVMLALGVLCYIGFVFLGLKYALPLAVIVGLTDIIPVIGPIIAMFPIMIVAFATMEIPQALIVGIYIIILQQIEGNILVPKIMSQSVGLHPILVIVSILIGSQLFGILGALLSIPFSVIALILFEEWQSTRI